MSLLWLIVGLAAFLYDVNLKAIKIQVDQLS